MAGQFSPLERKSIEPIALAVKDGNVRAMQRFVSDAPWSEDKMIAKYRSLVNGGLGSTDGALIEAICKENAAFQVYACRLVVREQS